MSNAFVSIDLDTLEPRQRGSLLLSAVTPRPVAWVSTVNSKGARNVAAFSYFNAVSTNPPLLAFSVGVYRDGRAKDTLNNLRAVPECVVHIGSGALIAQVEVTGTEYAPEVDEFAEARLTAAPSEVVRPPRIADAPVAIECAVRALHSLPDGSLNTLVVVRALRFHVRQDLIDGDYLIDVLRLDPISRLARKDYGVLGGVIDGQAEMDAFRRHFAPDHD
jgi:flavin reductase (DIM6/NTAB) family NADH-FMN oxidoreductase RutF